MQGKKGIISKKDRKTTMTMKKYIIILMIIKRRRRSRSVANTVYIYTAAATGIWWSIV